MVNEWTADDLPAVMDLVKASVDAMATDPSGGADAALDAVVDHLNAHHPKPDTDRLERQAATIGELQGSFLRVERDCSRLRRAHEIVERERDQARYERDKWEEKYLDTDEALHQARASLHEACKVAQSYKVDAYQATERAEAAERELDEWKSRAEAAEARTATAVTKADIEKAVAEWVDDAPEVVNEVWSLVSGADPATDPLLDKAQEFAALADWELTDREAELLHTVAAHVLGQEVK